MAAVPRPLREEPRADAHNTDRPAPTGWSSILHADFQRTPGFCDPLTCDHQNDENEPASPSWYCHGDRHEEAWEVTEKNASGSGCEWAYAFAADDRMLVLSSYTRSGQKMIGMFGCGDE